MALLKNIFGASSKSSVDRTNKWEEQLQSIYDQNINRGKFSYDMNADALYKQYAQQYEQNAKLAMQDTVGQVSALTGGYGNSYAQTAGQAVYNQQMSGLNDKALQLYQMALNQYNAEGDRLMQMYGITADQYQMEYNRIRDEIADEQWQKSYDEQQRQYNLGLAMDAAGMAMDMGQFMLGTAVDVGKFGAGMAFDISRAKAEDSKWQAEMDYTKERDAVADSQWQQKYERDILESDRYYGLEVDKFNQQKYEYANESAYREKRDAIEDAFTQKGLDLDKYQIDLNAALDREKIGLDKYQFDTSLAYDKARDKVSDDQFKQNLALEYAALNAKTGGSIKPTGGESKNSSDVVYTKEDVEAYIHETYGGRVNLISAKDFEPGKDKYKSSTYQEYLMNALDAWVSRNVKS